MTKSDYSIAAVATATGIAKEVLRKWEDRYGFPVPSRDASGRRVYDADQVKRLQMVKRLLDSGMRARQVVSLAAQGLEALLAAATPASAVLAQTIEPALTSALRADDPHEIAVFLRTQLQARGLRAFVCELVPALNAAVGLAWATGNMAIREEHLYTETLKTLLSEQIGALTVPPHSRRVLLSTAETELHTLGLMMVHAVLAMEQIDCIFLGASLSADEIAQAAAKYQVDVVALSFSDGYPLSRMRQFLGGLRKQLPAATALWAGGAGARRLVRAPAGISVISSLEDMVETLGNLKTPACI